jgi:general secretion pathway protein A
MYTKYFGFNEKPFTLTPNPRFIFLSRNHKEAFAHLLYGINNHYGFIELTGEVGTGKTTVLRTLLGQLQDENYRTALIFSPCLTGVELLRSINSEFGIESVSPYSNELLADLNRFLLAENAEGRTVVLVIDEAQNLQPEVLEQIRLISNLETENDKLIQIILAGQPELEILLERPDLRQLNQRIAVRYKLRSMSMPETRLYIRQRMEVAGDTGGVSFSDMTLKLIYIATRGVPRMINILCDRTLLIAYGDERRRITSGIVLRGIREVLNRSRIRKLALASVTGIVSCCLLVYLAVADLKPIARLFNKPSPRMPEVTRSPVAAVPKTPPSPDTSRLTQEILDYDQNDTHISVFNAFAELWKVRPLNVFSEELDIPDMFRRLAAKRNLRLTRINGTYDDVIRFDLPFIAVTNVTGDLGEYCYAVTAAHDGMLTISPALSDSSMISKEVFASVASGTFYLVWQNIGQIPDTLSRGEKRFEIRSLQKLLKRSGFYLDEINGVYSNATITAVNRFQHSMGITRDDSVGELTVAILTRFYAPHNVPSLKEGSRDRSNPESSTPKKQEPVTAVQKNKGQL